MVQEAFSLAKELKFHEITHQLYPGLWDQFDYSLLNRVSPQWTEIKFLNESGDDISDEMKRLPNNHGGIYIFIIKNPILPFSTEYLAYIGRAQYTSSHSLGVRCKKYFYEYVGPRGRSKITRMVELWGKNLYLKYATIDDNNDIITLEANLINAILPPFNEQIPDKIIKQATSAF